MISLQIKERESSATSRLMELKEMLSTKARKKRTETRRQLERRWSRTPNCAKLRRWKKWATPSNATSTETCSRPRVSLANVKSRTELLA